MLRLKSATDLLLNKTFELIWRRRFRIMGDPCQRPPAEASLVVAIYNERGRLEDADFLEQASFRWLELQWRVLSVEGVEVEDVEDHNRNSERRSRRVKR